MVGGARGSNRVVEVGRAEEGERGERPRLGAAAEAVDLPRRVVGRALRGQEGAGELAKLVGGGEAPEASPKTATSTKPGVSAGSRRSRPATEPPRGSSRPSSSARRKPSGESRSSSPRIRSPAGSPTRADAARNSSAVGSSRRKPSSSSMRTARSRRSGSSSKTDSQTARSRRAAVSLPAEGIHERPSAERPRERIDREVPRRQVLLDGLAVQRCEVERVAVAERDAPNAVPLGEREDRASGETRVEARRQLGVRAGDVDVHDLARSSSRSAPPTTHAGSSPTARRMRSSIDDPPLRPAPVTVETAGDLVVDRAENARAPRRGRRRRSASPPPRPPPPRARRRASPSRSSPRPGVSPPPREPPSP